MMEPEVVGCLAGCRAMCPVVRRTTVQSFPCQSRRRTRAAKEKVRQIAFPRASPRLRTAAQGLKPDYYADLIKQYEAAATPEEKQFAALFLWQHAYAFGFAMGPPEPCCAS